MIKVGVCGLGFMGRTHFTVFDQDPRATVVALMDHQPARRNGDWRDPLGNLESGWPSRVDMANRRGYATIEDLCADPEVELVDLTLPTHLHADAAVTALQARKHVLSEKPMALSSKDCKRIVEAAKKSRKYFMVAQCIRFWPQYAKIKELVSSRMYGKVRSLALRRMATPPGYSSGAWLMNHELSGGAIFDLHIHDVDFALYLMGKPKRVTAYGTTGPSGGIDHVLGVWDYGKDVLATIEGSWCFHEPYPFGMYVNVRCEKATIEWDMTKGSSLRIYHGGKSPEEIPVAETTGWHMEIDYMLSCIDRKKKPKIVTPESSALSIKLAESEKKSIDERRAVQIR
jgi:predicted dehydrogenase